MPRSKNLAASTLEELRAFGLKYPGAHTKSPWPGHLDLAVKGKTFAFLSSDGEPVSLSCKLPHSGAAALLLPFTKPTEYGLGKSGWVSASFPVEEAPPLDVLKAWIDESYRAVAPKKLVASIGAGAAPARKTAAKKKPAPTSKRPARAAAKKAPAKKRQAKAPAAKTERR